MLPRAYDFFPKESIKRGQTPTFSPPTHTHQQASAGLGSRLRTNPCVPQRATQPALEPMAVFQERTPPSAQSWEHGSFTW